MRADAVPEKVGDLGDDECRHEQRSCRAAEQLDAALVVAVAASGGRVERSGVDDEHQSRDKRLRRTARATCSSTCSEASAGLPSPIAKKLSSPGLGAGGSWRSIASRATSAI